jgi:putative ABC transport system ATP-binding protein
MMKPNHPVIDVQSLSLGFEAPLCHEVTFSLEAGDKVRIEGRSGCGKTTLLHCLLGFVRPLAGQITIYDQRLSPETFGSIRSRMAYVIQEPDLGTGTVKDTILRPFAYKINAHLHPTDRAILHLCDHFFLSKTLLAQDVTTLSGGQKQRVALITAILLKRDIILLDEPTSALDAISKVAVSEHFYHTDQTVLWVSHDTTAFDRADHVITLDSSCHQEAGS